ncbi:minor tail protein [Arthrobacter phage Casserole]|nr:minor tail protein [Arthrobacter phage Casserole]
MSGKPILIGPFVGGLNNISTAGEADDSQAVELVNMEVTLDSALTSRPPMEVVDGSLLANNLTEGWNVLGIHRVTSSEWYLIAQKWTGTDWSLGHMLNGNVAAFTQFKLLTGVSNKVTGYAQVDDYSYFSVGTGASIAGFKWRKADASPTDIVQMPRGNILISYKSRLWLAGRDSSTDGSTLWFSKIDATGVHLDQWNTSVDFLKVAPGEGGFITALLPLNNSILIFKNDGTWRFSYPNAPDKGQVDKISGMIGAANSRCVAEFENFVYVYDQGRVYELVNNIYNQINRFVRFDTDSMAVDGIANEVTLSVVTRRLIVRYYNTIYSYFVDTKTWSQWRSYCGTPGKFFELPADSSSSTQSTYIAESRGTSQSLSAELAPNISDPLFVTYANSKQAAGHTVSYVAPDTVKSERTTNGVSTGTIFFNPDEEYNLKMTAGQKLVFSGTYASSLGNGTARITYLLKNGASAIVENALTAGPFSVTFRAPDGALAGYLTVYNSVLTTTGQFFSVQNPSLKRTVVQSPQTLIKITDQYAFNANVVEFIKCHLRTKSYDYQAPSAHKRLFWWGIDMKTTNKVLTKAIPIAKQLPISWGQLEAYTHTQLSQGTAGNPLVWLTTSLTVLDEADVSNSSTENGRIFAKILKSLRFRQISFEVDLETYGNSTTGPTKLFSITSYVLPKEKVFNQVN